MRKRQWAVVGAVTVLAALTIPAAAIAGPGARSAPSPQAVASKGGDLKVQIAVNRFARKGSKTVAEGTVNAEVMDYAGHRTVIHEPVTLTAKRGGSCRILTLTLDQLTLSLLGLNVDL